MLEIFKNNFTVSYLEFSLFAEPNITDLLQRKHPRIIIQNDPPLVELSVADIRWQIAAEWLEIAQLSQ